MGTEKLDTQIRREQIAQAALSLLGAHGLKGLSVTRVAHHVGIVPSAIYRHFKSKDAILDAVIDLIRERLLANVSAASEETSDSVERLKRLLMRHAKLIRESEAIPLILFSEDVYFQNPRRKARIHGTITEYLGRVADMVRRGQEQGQIRHGLDPAAVSVMFLGMVQPAAILWHLSDGRFNVTRQVEKAWEIFREALTGGSRP